MYEMLPGLTKLQELKLVNLDWLVKMPKPFEIFYETIGPALRNQEYYPNSLSIFRAFNECSVANLKVVILGMDPYHDGSATGLAFDNRANRIKISPSLQQIRREMAQDVGELYNISPSPSIGSHLDHLPKQGVLLLNTALTVEPKKPGSHTKLWEPFTNEVVGQINEKFDNIVWILWGNHAKSFKSKITNKTHHIIEGGHPSPLNTKTPFAGGKYFSKCNAFLKSVNKSPIKW